MNKINKMIKDKKKMIKSILLGFTFVISIYSTLRTIGLEETISRLRSDIPIIVENVYFKKVYVRIVRDITYK